MAKEAVNAGEWALDFTYVVIFQIDKKVRDVYLINSIHSHEPVVQSFITHFYNLRIAQPVYAKAFVVTNPGILRG